MKYTFTRRLLLSLILLLSLTAVKAQTIPANRLTDWNKAGMQDSIPLYGTTINIMQHGADNTGVNPCNAAFTAAMAALGSAPGIIYFPQGTYRFDQQLLITKDSTVLKGDGGNTKLVFNFNNNSNDAIMFLGSVSPANWLVSQPVDKGDSVLTLNNTNGLTTGDWIKVYTTDNTLLSSTWAYETIGQIVQIKKIQGNDITVDMPLRRAYEGNPTTRINLIKPVKGCGVECFYTEREDTAALQPSNIMLQNAVNCWVIGVESNKCMFAHVNLMQCAHTLVRSNYFHHGHSYGGNGRAYGVVAQYTTSDCIVANNKFEHLRHSMLLQAGANGNVFAHNYSTDPNWDEPPLPANSAGDLVLHGNYPYLNLFEGNVVQHIVIDNSHGINGPYNTIFRNRAQGYGIFMNNTPATDSVNFAGNEVTSTASFQGNFSLQGNGHYLFGNNVKGTITPAGTTNLQEKSLHFSDYPGYFLQTLATTFIGTPKIYNSQHIPAETNHLPDCTRNPVLVGDYVVEVNKSHIQLTAYPNPATDNILFKATMVDNIRNMQLVVIDLMGRVCFTATMVSNQTANWNTAGVTAGIYFYQLRSADHVLATGKVTVAK